MGETGGQMAGLNKKIGWAIIGLAALLLLAWILIPQLLHVPVPDESTFIYEGWRVSQGQVPYRDFFEFIGPGTLYTVAALIKLFGIRLLALRLSMVLVIAACCWLTYQLSRLVLPPVWRWVYVLFMVVIYLPSLVVQHHFYSALVALLAVWFLFRYLENPARKRNLWWSGIMVGLTALYTQSLGGLMGAALGVFLVLYFSRGQLKQIPQALGRTTLHFILPCLVPVVLVVGFFASQHALHDLIYDMFGWLMEGQYARTTSSWYMLEGFTKLTSYGPAILKKPLILATHPDITMLLAVILLEGTLPILGLLWAAQVLWQRFPRAGWRWAFADFSGWHWQFLMLVAASMAFFVANFSYPTSVLISLHGWIYYAFAFAALASLARRTPSVKSISVIAMVLLTAGRLLAMGIDAWNSYQTPGIISYGTEEKVLSSLNYSPESSQATSMLLQYLHDNSPPGSSLFVYNGAPELYVLTGRTNPTRYQILMALYNTPGQIREAVADLTKKRPTFIIYNQLDKLNFERDLRFLKVRGYDYRLTDLEALLARDYVLAGQMANLMLFQRRDTLPAGAAP